MRTKQTQIMEIKELKINRNRIIRNIKIQGADTSKVMANMVEMIGRYDKATMKNIDNLTNDAIQYYFKNEYEAPVFDIAEKNRENAQNNLPSSLR